MDFRPTYDFKGRFVGYLDQMGRLQFKIEEEPDMFNQASSVATSLAKAITEQYKEDSIRPGITISYLGDARGFYASVVRWPAHDRKVVEMSVDGHKTAADAVVALATAFTRYTSQKKTARDELVEILVAVRK